MLKRTIYLGSPLDLNIRLEQLVLVNRETGELNKVPIEDVGVVVLDHPELIYSQAVMQKLLANNTAVIYCDEKHHPTGLLLPLCGHSVQNERFRQQLSAKKPLQKQLWQQTVQAKIRNQALMLRYHKLPHEPLLRFWKEVRSGDSTNLEARAARHYWQHVFSPLPFRRDRFGEAPNNLLNYGYAILRAAVARALVSSGLLPTIGIHHHNRYNAYCLADDVMEPYRPVVDSAVKKLFGLHPDCSELTKPMKSALLQTLTHDVRINGETSPLLVGLNKTTTSLVACFAGERDEIAYPELCKTD
ncbi:type II CRISPR-associated endonuclease Cas1 [Pontibacter sp. MBLB2868]|uniref:type II CRISPR-associated endonuclease Cas1 n=1 Tax=Pontibacter sp. MBLB2868 TaxID=3451555 RepID=UPI003F7540E3